MTADIVALAPLNKRCSQHYGIIFVHECENCRLVQSHKCRQTAPNRVLNFNKFPQTAYTGDLPRHAGGVLKGKGGGQGEGKREREEGGKGEEGLIHLLLPQAHTAVAAYTRGRS